MDQVDSVLDEVEHSPIMQSLWQAYRKKFSYASGLEWTMIMKEIRGLFLFSKANYIE